MPFYEMMFHFWTQESMPLNCRESPLSQRLSAVVPARTLTCVFAAISCLPWGQLVVYLLGWESLAQLQLYTLSPH